MIVKIVFFALSLALKFHIGQTNLNLTHGEVYQFQNYKDRQYLTAAHGGSFENPSAVETAHEDGKLEQLWEVNLAGYDKEANKTHFLIRSLRHSFNKATFESKFCPITGTNYTKIVYYRCEPVVQNTDEEIELWYLKKLEGKRGSYTTTKCLAQEEGKVEIADCADDEAQKWSIDFISEL